MEACNALLKHIGFLKCQASDNPIDMNKKTKLPTHSGTLLPNPQLYQSLVD